MSALVAAVVVALLSAPAAIPAQQWSAEQQAVWSMIEARIAMVCSQLRPNEDCSEVFGDAVDRVVPLRDRERKPPGQHREKRISQDVESGDLAVRRERGVDRDGPDVRFAFGRQDDCDNASDRLAEYDDAFGVDVAAVAKMVEGGAASGWFSPLGFFRRARISPSVSPATNCR